MTQDLVAGNDYDQRKIMADLVAQQYRRNDQAFQRGSFRVRGDSLEIWPAHLEDRAWRMSFMLLLSLEEPQPEKAANVDTRATKKRIFFMIIFLSGKDRNYLFLYHTQTLVTPHNW